MKRRLKTRQNSVHLNESMRSRAGSVLGSKGADCVTVRTIAVANDGQNQVKVAATDIRRFPQLLKAVATTMPCQKFRGTKKNSRIMRPNIAPQIM